jgi:UDP-glucose 4-epimerase
MLKGFSPIMYDSGIQMRCFTFIDDMIDALMLASTCKKAIGRAINIGSTEAVAIKDLLKLMINISGKNLEVKSVSTKAKFGQSYEDIEARIPTVSLAGEILGWKARTLLQDGLKLTFSWYKENTWFWRNFDEKE